MAMVTWLRKTFIRDYQNLADARVRSAHGVLSSWIGIFLNAILVGLKLTSALLLASSNAWVFSMALLGDALNNFFDFSSSIIALIGFRLSKKPADKEHPYGHGRAEYIAGMLIGVAIIVSASMLLFRSVQSVIETEEVRYDLFAFLALAMTLPLKGFQSYLNFSLGKKLSSPTLFAVGRDALIDVALSTSMLIGLLVSYLAHLPSLDGYLGIAVSAFLAYAGIKAMKEAADPLLGAPLSSELQKQVEDIALKEEHVRGVHDFLCHSYGENVRFLSFHVEIDQDLSLKEAHEIIDRIEEKVAEATQSSVVAHADPIDIDDDRLSTYKEKVEGILQPHGLSFHDLHFKEGVLYVDILLPFDFKEEEREKVLEELKSLDVKVSTTFDHPYSD